MGDCMDRLPKPPSGKTHNVIGISDHDLPAELDRPAVGTEFEPDTTPKESQHIQKHGPLRRFSLFSWLPFELRLIIWELCLPPRAPGAHFFMMANQKNKKTLSRHFLLAAIARRGNSGGFFTAIDTSRNNKSMYMMGWGLWEACRESRRVIDKHLLRGDDRILWTGETLWFQNTFSTYILPYFRWGDVQCYAAPDILDPFFSPLLEHCPVAFEYDDSWRDFFPGPTPQRPQFALDSHSSGKIFAAVFTMYHPVYFIDRTIRPRSKEDCRKKKQPAFQFEPSPAERASLSEKEMAAKREHLRQRYERRANVAFHALGYDLVVVDEENEAKWDFGPSGVGTFVKQLNAAVAAYVGLPLDMFGERIENQSHIRSWPGGAGLLACVPHGSY